MVLNRWLLAALVCGGISTYGVPAGAEEAAATAEAPPAAAEVAAPEPAPAPAATGTITIEQAAEHVGEVKTVCGVVSATRYLDDSNKRPTFLNFGAPFPNHSFTAVIMGINRDKFSSPPEIAFKGKRVCVTGLIRVSHSKPEIEIRDPSEIKVDETVTPPAAE